MLGRTDSRLRMMALLLIFVMIGSAAVLRLGYWQVVAAPALAVDAITNMTPPKTAEVARAQIVDRDGVVLAQSATFDRLDAHPRDIEPEEREGVVGVLTAILDLSVEEQEAYREKLANGRAWDWLDRRLTHRQSADVRIAQDDRKLPGISLAPRDVRAYPKKGGQGGTTVASHLLGFVAGDGRGAYGVERLYDDRLTGKDLSKVPVASIEGISGGLDLEGHEAPPLKLTIDFKLQKQLEKELNTARLANRARSASAIIMDPHTGEILAAASVPGYNANDFAKVASKHPGQLRNPMVSDIFEPGSVMKIFTATAALELGVVTPQTKIKDEPKIKFYKYDVHNSDEKGMGMISVQDAVAYSRNVAIAKTAARLAPKSVQKAAHRLYDLWDKVGLVGKTGVDIAGEEKGIYWDPDESLWAPVDLANRAFGQSVGVTLVQLATGFSTLVNGGYRIQPHVVAEGEQAQVPKERALKAKIARQAQGILTRVTGAVPWYARGALIPGYMIGGKTGTAQIWDSKVGAWKEDAFNHNFVGFVGRNRPDVVIAVRIEEAKYRLPKGVMDLKIESYELFQMIARGAIKHLGIKKSKDRNAGLPILGTDAARQLTPQRQANAKQQARQEAKRKAAKAERTAKTEKAARGENAKREKASEAARGSEAGSSDSAET